MEKRLYQLDPQYNKEKELKRLNKIIYVKSVEIELAQGRCLISVCWNELKKRN